MKRNSIAILVVFAEVKEIDNYIIYLAGEIKKLIRTVAITVNGELDQNSVETLNSCSDFVFIRENKGFDCGAYKDTLENFIGWDKVREYEELILLNDSCYGPIYPLEPVFEQMDMRKLDFWGITEQTPVKAGNYSRAVLPHHVQTYFVVIGNKMLQSTEFTDFWNSVTVSDEYDSTVANFELRFTEFFSLSGYTSGAYVDCGAFCKSENETQAYIFMDSYYLISEHRCPFVKKKVFLYPHDLVLSSNAGETAYKTIEYITENTDYDQGLIWQHLIRKCEPQKLYLSVHGNYCLSADHAHGKMLDSERLLVIAWLPDHTMMKKCISYLDQLPSFAELVLLDENGTCSKKTKIEKYDYVCFLNNENMDDSLFFVFWENMIPTSCYIYNIIDTFKKHPELGLLSPPKPYHADYFSDKCSYPYGNMFWCRREVIRSVKFPDNKSLISDYKKFCSSLPYVARDQGYACGIIMTGEYASVSISNYHYMLSGIVANILLRLEIQEFKNVRKINPQLTGFCAKYPSCYIYGAGECGRECYAFLQLSGVNVSGFIVSDGKKDADKYEDLEIFELSDLTIDENTGIVIAMNHTNTSKVIKILKERGIYGYVQYEV